MPCSTYYCHALIKTDVKAADICCAPSLISVMDSFNLMPFNVLVPVTFRLCLNSKMKFFWNKSLQLL